MSSLKPHFHIINVPRYTRLKVVKAWDTLAWHHLVIVCATGWEVGHRFCTLVFWYSLKTWSGQTLRSFQGTRVWQASGAGSPGLVSPRPLVEFVPDFRKSGGRWWPPVERESWETRDPRFCVSSYFFKMSFLQCYWYKMDVLKTFSDVKNSKKFKYDL